MGADRQFKENKADLVFNKPKTRIYKAKLFGKYKKTRWSQSLLQTPIYYTFSSVVVYVCVYV